jgi:hypothetical protein
LDDVTDVQRYDGGQHDGRYDNTFDRTTGQQQRQKRLMTNNGGSKLVWYLSNSFLLVALDPTPDCLPFGSDTEG